MKNYINITRDEIMETKIFMMDTNPNIAAMDNPYKVEATKACFAVLYSCWEMYSHIDLDDHCEAHDICEHSDEWSITKWASSGKSEYKWIYIYYATCCQRMGDLSDHDRYWFYMLRFPNTPIGIGSSGGFKPIEFPRVSGKNLITGSGESLSLLNRGDGIAGI